MASYYEYFAAGQEICQPAFTSYMNMVTVTKLCQVCLPRHFFFDTCMDLSMIAPHHQLGASRMPKNQVCSLLMLQFWIACCV